MPPISSVSAAENGSDIFQQPMHKTEKTKKAYYRLFVEFFALDVALFEEFGGNEVCHLVLDFPRFGDGCQVTRCHQHAAEKACIARFQKLIRYYNLDAKYKKMLPSANLLVRETENIDSYRRIRIQVIPNIQ